MAIHTDLLLASDRYVMRLINKKIYTCACAYSEMHPHGYRRSPFLHGNVQLVSTKLRSYRQNRVFTNRVLVVKLVRRHERQGRDVRLWNFLFSQGPTWLDSGFGF